jgi:hypothetical protein
MTSLHFLRTFINSLIEIHSIGLACAPIGSGTTSSRAACWRTDCSLMQSSRFRDRRLRHTANNGTASRTASRNQREFIVCSSTEIKLRDTGRFKARGNNANSETEPRCQLCEEEVRWRGRAEWDQKIEVGNAARAYGENAGDSTAEVGKPLSGDGKCL